MTVHDIERLTPLVLDLQRRGIVAAFATTSWPIPGQTPPGCQPVERAYAHAFRLRSPGLHQHLTVEHPFTEDQLIEALAMAEARQNHAPAVHSTLTQVGEALLRDLAAAYALRLRGKPVPLPAEITVKDVRIPLPAVPAALTSPSAPTPPSS